IPVTAPPCPFSAAMTGRANNAASPSTIAPQTARAGAIMSAAAKRLPPDRRADITGGRLAVGRGGQIVTRILLAELRHKLAAIGVDHQGRRLEGLVEIAARVHHHDRIERLAVAL